MLHTRTIKEAAAYFKAAVLAPGVHSQFGSGKNSQFKPEQ